MSATSLIADSAGIATALGVAFAGLQLKQGRRQRQLQFEDGFARQYRELIKPGLEHPLLSNLPKAERSAVSVTSFSYIDLCNEQVYLRMQGRVATETWREWAEGIASYFRSGQVPAAWLVVHAHLDDEFHELALFLASRGSDPRTWSPWWRRVVGREYRGDSPAARARAMARQPDPPRITVGALGRP